MTSKERAAKKAIEQGKTMGQFLRDLPDSKKLSKQELEQYAKAYHRVRMAK